MSQPSQPITAVYLDFSSPACHRVWCWLSATSALERIEVRPFWSESPVAAGGRGPWERPAPTSGLELLALGEFARELGTRAHHRFVDAAFTVLHEEAAESSGLELWLSLGARAGLDMDAFTEDVERWRAEVGLWHEEARDELGVDGVPALVFGENRAIRVDLEAAVTEPDEAEALLEQVTALAASPLTAWRRTSG